MISILTKDKDACLLGRLNAKDVADRWQAVLSVNVGEEFRSLGVIEYWKCNDTGFCWYTPGVAAGGAELYVQLQEFDWYYKREKWEFSAAIELIAENEAVLEVGVGEGYFLDVAKKRNRNNLVGLELNPKSADKARNLGFRVYDVPLAKLREETTERFDVVCAFQVLEHVPDPRQFLEGMICMLRPGGRLILSVPNAEIMRKIDPGCRDLLNSPPHHMGHWDENCLRALQRVLPLELTLIRREPLADYHVSWILTAYLRSFLSSFGTVIPRLLFNRYTLMPIELVMKLGLRRFFHGHTILVEFLHKPN
jgi:2-polyprenyl-3-methyl-5-hydroxy-6-metoxy-1,4-benzoquinol methylase